MAYIFDYLAKEDYLAHHGIKGQKWGVQNGPPYPLEEKQKSSKERTLNKDLDERTILQAKTKKGETLTISQDERSKFSRLLAKGSKAINKRALNTKIFTIKTKDKTVGDVQIYQESADSVNGVWLGVDEKYRGKGYGQAALAEVIDECRRRGYKQFTLEVPGNAPDARHIYEKMGFIAGEQVTSSDDDWYWEGLTKMRLQL